MKDTVVQGSQRNKIVSTRYLRFEIGDRCCSQYFSTDEKPIYVVNFGTVYGYVYINGDVLAVDDEYRRVGWHYFVLFDKNIGEVPSTAFFDHVHEGDLFSPEQMRRWDSLVFLLRLLFQSLKRKVRGGF